MTPRRQRGAALLLLLAVLTLGGTWYLISGLQAASGDFVAAERRYNAAVLARAKRALVGYVAHQAAVSGENNPGAFLCPEAAANVGTGNEGLAPGNCTLPAVGRLPWKTLGIEKLQDASGEPLWYVVANGWAKPSAAANTIINSNCSDSGSAMTCWSGQLTVDGRANAAVALIIAPGKVMSVQASAGCTARNQARTTPSPTINPLDYLECYNTATSTFATNGPSTSFNDQVVAVTAAEVLPLIEGAIADRFQHDFATQLRSVYSGGSSGCVLGGSPACLWPTAPVVPFAVPFSNPTTNPANKLQGTAGTLTGLLPASYTFTSQCNTCASGSAPCACPAPTVCTVAASDPRCDPAFVLWRATANAGCAAANCTAITQTGGASLHSSSSCTVSGTPSMLTCTLNTSMSVLQLFSGTTWVTFNVDATAANVGMTWKNVVWPVPPAALIAPAITGIDTAYVNSSLGYQLCQPGQPATPCVTASNLAVLNSDGSATLRINARVLTTLGSVLGVLSGITCNFFGIPLCYTTTVSVPIALFGDHDVVDPSNAAYNWFYRNRWPEVSYYAVAGGIAPSGARSCTTSSTCLQVNYTSSADSGKQRAILIIGGQKLSTLDAAGNPYTQVRPATQVKDLLDDINAAGASPFELRSATLAPNRAFNDHFAVIDKNP